MRMKKFAHTPAASPATRRMSRGQIVVIALLAMLWSTACSQPTIDGSSTRRYFESKEEVRASLSADERGRFDNAINVIEMNWAGTSLMTGLAGIAQGAVDGLSSAPRQQQPEPPTPFQTLHGRTAREVIAMADSIAGAEPAR